MHYAYTRDARVNDQVSRTKEDSDVNRQRQRLAHRETNAYESNLEPNMEILRLNFAWSDKEGMPRRIQKDADLVIISQ